MSINLERPLCRLVVVSDLHAFSSKDKDADSLLDLSDSSSASSTPLDDLIEDAKAGRVQADALICAGDICNRADAGGLARAWTRLHALREAVGAKELIATCGNHDLDSRYLENQPDPDPKGSLLTLQPGFPFADEGRANKFWARNYVVASLPDVTIVNVNTSAQN